MKLELPAKVFLETAIPSYLTARTSRDLLRAGCQQATHDWWETDRREFDLFVSELVLEECAAGDAEAAIRRLAVLDEIPVLQLTTDATALGRALLEAGGLPPNAAADALHIAIAAVHGMDYLLTWNCAHIANVRMRARIEAVCRSVGFQPPIICTPIEFTEE